MAALDFSTMLAEPTLPVRCSALRGAFGEPRGRGRANLEGPRLGFWDLTELVGLPEIQALEGVYSALKPEK